MRLLLVSNKYDLYAKWDMKDFNLENVRDRDLLARAIGEAVLKVRITETIKELKFGRKIS